MTAFRTLILAAAAFAATALTALAGDPTGTWKFKAESPQGRSAEVTLTLQWQNNQLTGSIDNRAGKAAIQNTSFTNELVSFAVTREFGRGFRKRTITTRYSGKLAGDTIKGTIETTTPRDQKPVSIPWEAQRVK